MERRRFLAFASAGACLLLEPGSASPAESSGSTDINEVPLEFPRQASAEVKEVVALSHRSLEGVRRLVDARPALAKAAWDWGFGDWETALGAASHTGQRDIALYLIDKGARPDIFTLAMLGHAGAVKALVEASPGIEGSAGPHGITLLAHARAGGDPARGVVEYLESLGGADPRPKAVALSDAQRESVLGTYVHGAAEGERFSLEMRRQGLMLVPAGGVARGLVHIGARVFHPVGAPDVRIAFTGGERVATSVTIRDGALEIVAERPRP